MDYVAGEPLFYIVFPTTIQGREEEGRLNFLNLNDALFWATLF